MKIKNNYVLQAIADEYIVVPVAEEANRLHGIIRLNETGAFLWEYFEKGVANLSELEMALTHEFNINQATAQADIGEFICKLKEIDCLEN